MSWFNSFVTSLCAAGICFGALYILCPEGKMSKSVKYVFSLCFLLIIISVAGITVKKADFNFDLSSEINTDTVDTQIAIAEYTYGLALKIAGIDFSEITVFTDNSDTDSINISKVLIYSDSNRERIITALGEAAKNFEVVVINE